MEDPWTLWEARLNHQTDQWAGEVHKGANQVGKLP